MTTPVCYELNENGERYGGVYRFCSEDCAEFFTMVSLPAEDQFPRYEWGEDETPPEEPVFCVECGKRIEP